LKLRLIFQTHNSWNSKPQLNQKAQFLFNLILKNKIGKISILKNYQNKKNKIKKNEIWSYQTKRAEIMSSRYLLPFPSAESLLINAGHQMISRMSRAQLFSNLWIPRQPVRNIFGLDFLIFMQRFQPGINRQPLIWTLKSSMWNINLVRLGYLIHEKWQLFSS
jgi:hypothetical protein